MLIQLVCHLTNNTMVMNALTLPRGQCCQLRLAHVSRSPLAIRSWSFSAHSSLTTHSAEVNIGIVAACLPTLIPLYRLVRDKIIAFRKNLPSMTGRFYVNNGKLLFGRTRSAKTSQQSIRDSQREDEIALPQNAQWKYSMPVTPVGVKEVGYDDVEMQTLFGRSH